jgi:cytosine permease
MTEASEEFATEPVPDSRTVPWIRVGVISAMVAFSLPTFVTGIEVARAVDGKTAALAILCGNLLLAVIGSICASIGARTRLSSYMLTRIAFGTRGAVLVNLAFAISLLGWFGVNIDLFGAAVARLLSDVFAVAPPNWIVELGAGVVMTTTTIYGFRAINSLSLLLVPVLMVVTAMLVSQALEVRSLGEVFASTVEDELSFGAAMSSVVGGVIIGAVILPDITRFIRNWRGGIYTAVLSYAVIGSIVQGAGALAAIAFGNDDLLDVMIVIGLSWAAFAIVIAGSWVLNSLNLYSTSLSVEATIMNLNNRLLIVVLGALGTIAAFFNILDYFLTFLFYLAIVFAPVAGVIAVDYILLRRDAYHGERLAAERDILPLALLAWLAGAIVALLGSEALLRITGIAALDAILVAAAAHYSLSRIAPYARSQSEAS